MQDQIVLITGASGGIGAELAKLAGARGAVPVLAARRQEALAEVAAQSGPRAETVVCDVRKKADVDALVAGVVARHGRLDVLVNNAGQGMSRMPSQVTAEDLDEMMLVNVKSALWAIQAALPHFQAQGRGHVINVSSLLGRVSLAAVRAAYSASKAALNSLTASLRLELAQTHPGIHITGFHPGVVATDFGLNSVHGGADNRKLPGAQDPVEVAEAIIQTILDPRADVYSRPQYRDLIARYYADVDLAEKQPPFAAR